MNNHNKESRGRAKHLLFYAMGGMAAPVLKTAIQKAAHGLDITHVNVLNPIHAMELHAAQKYRGWAHTLHPKKIKEQLEALTSQGRRLKVLTLVDDPIQINVASYFQSLDLAFNRPNAAKAIPPHLIAEGFFKKHSHDFPITWFNKEIQQTMGLDVYAQPSPAGQRFLKSENSVCEILVVRKDLADEKKAALISELIGLEGLVFEHADAQNERRDPERYQAFLEALRIPQGYIDRMLNSRYALHFFTPSERVSIARKWGGDIVATGN